MTDEEKKKLEEAIQRNALLGTIEQHGCLMTFITLLAAIAAAGLFVSFVQQAF